jgi:hypothetical protein
MLVPHIPSYPVQLIKNPQPNTAHRDVLLQTMNVAIPGITDIIFQYMNVKRCGHQCQLQHIPNCCSCTDLRPYYIVDADDGTGSKIQLVKQYIYFDDRTYKKLILNRAKYYCYVCSGGQSSYHGMDGSTVTATQLLKHSRLFQKLAADGGIQNATNSDDQSLYEPALAEVLSHQIDNNGLHQSKPIQQGQARQMALNVWKYDTQSHEHEHEREHENQRSLALEDRLADTQAMRESEMSTQ